MADKAKCERCGRGVPPRMSDTDFCSKKCMRAQIREDDTSAQMEKNDVANAEAQQAETGPLMSDNGFPRRCRVDLYSGAERAIQWAVDVCETTLPADPLETDAIILLGKAREKVADLVDREIRLGRMPMPAAVSLPTGDANGK